VAAPGGKLGVGLLFRCQAQSGEHTGRSGFCWAVLVFPVRVVGWSLVENCTVDASILFSVVKLLRADGGCLGTRSR
jgi:hypothetical protein